jgi:hypothetical protein
MRRISNVEQGISNYEVMLFVNAVDLDRISNLHLTEVGRWIQLNLSFIVV